MRQFYNSFLVCFGMKKSVLLPLSLSQSALAHNYPLTHPSSHGFPCSGLGLVSPYFLFWLQAVSFFRSCIYPLGMLTSFAQQFINSLSTPFPENLFSLYRQNIILFRCCLVSPLDIYFKEETLSLGSHKVRVLFGFLSGYNLSQLKYLIQ